MDTKPREQIIAAQCATIAKEYAEQSLIPTDKVLQKWGEEYANQHYEESDNPLSQWWLEAEAFTNGCRAVVEHIKNKNKI